MNSRNNHCALVAAITLATAGMVACGGGGDGSGTGSSGGSVSSAGQEKQAVAITSFGPNVVDDWNRVGVATVTIPAAPSGTPEERQPTHDADMATMHVAIYDALAAITRTHQPFMAVMPNDPAVVAMSQEYAVHGAAYTVLSTLFPARSDQYKSLYDMAIASADAAALASAQFGADVARKVLAQRENDGRWTSLTPYVAGTEPGQFRGTNPVNRMRAFLRPFSLKSADQFRPDGPPALGSPEYAADLNETKAMGGAISTQRTESQTENARFMTESPVFFWTRNLRQFATSKPTLIGNARLMAMLMIAQTDASIGCFEAKYFYNAWRPTSAIRLADTDGNAATEPDTLWTPVVPTPNHPEYPGGHSCNTGATAEVLQQEFGTKKIRFSLNSTVTGTTIAFESVDEMNDAVQQGRIHGGMHFRTATVHGRVLGEKVVRQLVREHFKPVSP